MEGSIDRNKVNKIRRDVYRKEEENLKRTEKEKMKDSEMVKEIKKIVRNRVDQCL